MSVYQAEAVTAVLFTWNGVQEKKTVIRPTELGTNQLCKDPYTVVCHFCSTYSLFVLKRLAELGNMFLVKLHRVYLGNKYDSSIDCYGSASFHVRRARSMKKMLRFCSLPFNDKAEK
jgi:hypothetical protein